MMYCRGVTVSVFVLYHHGSGRHGSGRHGSDVTVRCMQSHDEYAFFLRVGKKSVIQGSIHYTIYNPGGGIAPKSCLPAALKQQMKKKKKTQQNEQNTRRRKVSIASSDNTQELEDLTHLLLLNQLCGNISGSLWTTITRECEWWIGRGRCASDSGAVC